MVRPPALSAPWWAAASIPRARPETIVNPVPRQRRGQAFGDPQPIGRAPPRADQGDGELIARLESTSV